MNDLKSFNVSTKVSREALSILKSWENGLYIFRYRCRNFCRVLGPNLKAVTRQPGSSHVDQWTSKPTLYKFNYLWNKHIFTLLEATSS